MQSLQAWVSILVACAGAGAFIDFVIGKKGQKRARDWLETWWIQLASVRARTFGRDEARMAAQLIDAACGRFFSVQRLRALGLIVLVGLLLWAILVNLVPAEDHGAGPHDLASDIALLAVTALNVSFSITLTAFLSRSAARVMTESVTLNFLFFLLVVLSQFLVLFLGEGIMATAILSGSDWVFRTISGRHTFENMFWFDMKSAIYGAIESAIPNLRYMTGARPGIHGALDFNTLTMMYWPTIARLGIAITFLVSVLFKPVHSLVLLLLARVVESEKPVFTLVLGGLGAILKAGHEIASKL